MSGNQKLQKERQNLISLQNKKSYIETAVINKLNSYKYYNKFGNFDGEYANFLSMIGDDLEDGLSGSVIYLNNNYSSQEINEMDLERVKEAQKKVNHDLSHLISLDNGLNELFMMISPKCTLEM